MDDKCIERVYCCDRGNNDNALTAAILANRDNNNDMMPAMMMGGFGMNQWMNNPFAYMMMMAWMRNFNGGEWGNGGAQGIELQNQIESLRNQLGDNNNTQLLREAIGDGFSRNDFALSQLAQNLNVDFNMLQKCCCDVQAAIQGVAGQVGFSAERVINAANMGDCRIIEALNSCCCATQRQIADFRADVQLQMCQQTGTLQRDLAFVDRSIERGFAGVGFKQEQDKCDIINAINAAQQRNADMLNNHWSQEQQLQIQDLKNQLSQRDQTDAIFARLRNGSCGCNNGCGCGNNSGF